MPVRPIALGEGAVGHVAQTRQGIIINDYRAWVGARQLALTHTAITACLGEPLLYRDRLIGVINLIHTAGKGTFAPQHGTLLRLFGDQAAIAIENARLFQDAQQALGDLQRAQSELVRSEQLRGLGQMAAGIAHDLNNTLATVLGQAELLRLQATQPKVQEGLALLETAAADGAAVVRRLQEFARPKGTSPLAPCDLAVIVREAIELTRPRWQDESQRRGVTITVEMALDNLPLIQGSPPELREALTNLIFNATDAMPDGGALSLRGNSTQETVTLTVTDTGSGMPPEVQEKLFEPFFTTKGVKGTGLGLAVVYGIMARHGGNITVTSAPRQGTTFTLAFLRASATPPTTAPAAALPALQTPLSLLVVDDEDLVRQTLAMLLRTAGHSVVEAADGPNALAALVATPVDAVITDLGMPGMSGWELARRLKGQSPGLPVILLTGWQEQAPGDEADRRSVDAILGKPVRLDELSRVIQEIAVGGGNERRS
jgi:signal transduction histidine kinase/CheY-like chemotaxis protein